jgi:hypothetical protein
LKFCNPLKYCAFWSATFAFGAHSQGTTETIILSAVGEDRQQ